MTKKTKPSVTKRTAPKPAPKPKATPRPATPIKSKAVTTPIHTPKIVSKPKPAPKPTPVAKPKPKPKAKPAAIRDKYPSRASVGAGYVTKDTKPSAIKQTAPKPAPKVTPKIVSKPKPVAKPAPKPAVTRDAYPNRATVGAGYITKDTTPSITKSTPSDNPRDRFINQTIFGMNKEAQTEYNRLAGTDSDWADITDAERVRRARNPQIMAQLPHAFIDNPRTKVQKDIYKEHGRAPSASFVGADGELSLTFDETSKPKPKPKPKMQPVQTPTSSVNNTALTDIDETITKRLPGWQKRRKAGQRRYGYGRRGTLLTGPGGISDDALTIGRSLLGGF